MRFLKKKTYYQIKTMMTYMNKMKMYQKIFNNFKQIPKMILEKNLNLSLHINQLISKSFSFIKIMKMNRCHKIMRKLKIKVLLILMNFVINLIIQLYFKTRRLIKIYLFSSPLYKINRKVPLNRLVNKLVKLNKYRIFNINSKIYHNNRIIKIYNNNSSNCNNKINNKPNNNKYSIDKVISNSLPFNIIIIQSTIIIISNKGISIKEFKIEVINKA